MFLLYFQGLLYRDRLIASIFIGLATLGMPTILAIASLMSGWTVSEEPSTSLIAAFSIFSAMLFASQVAAFSVYIYRKSDIRKPDLSLEKIEYESRKATYDAQIKNLRQAFKRINGGISTLTFLAIFITVLAATKSTAFFSLYQAEISALLSLLVSHFLISFLSFCHHIFVVFDSAFED